MSVVAADLSRSKLRVGDVLRVGSLGLRTRRLRTGLSTLGVAIGIAAMVGVLGLSASSQEDLNSKIRALGTNLLEVQAGAGFGRGSGELPTTAVGMVSRIGPVTAVSSLTTVDTTVRRTDTISEGITSGISVFAADEGLLDTLHAQLVDGTWFNAATSTYPAVVLGVTAAEKLGVVDVADGLRVYIGDQWFAVIGILDHVAAAEGLDRAAIVGVAAAETYILGETIAPFRLQTPLDVVLPWIEDQLIAEDDDRLDEHPGLAQWWRTAVATWNTNRSSNKLTLTGQLDYMGKLRRQFPPPAHRVVYTKGGMHLAAALRFDIHPLMMPRLLLQPLQHRRRSERFRCE